VFAHGLGPLADSIKNEQKTRFLDRFFETVEGVATPGLFGEGAGIGSAGEDKGAGR
jgi:hypothetical protein